LDEGELRQTVCMGDKGELRFAQVCSQNPPQGTRGVCDEAVGWEGRSRPSHATAWNATIPLAYARSAPLPHAGELHRSTCGRQHRRHCRRARAPERQGATSEIREEQAPGMRSGSWGAL
jgi:hypothetical protein